MAGTIQPAIKAGDLMEIIVPKLDKRTRDKIIKKIKNTGKARQKIKEELDETRKTIGL